MKRFHNKIAKKLVTLNSYDCSAEDYAKNTNALQPLEDAKKFIEKLPSNAKIIDIGCGPGRDAKMFSDLGFEVIGIDFSAKMIDLAKKNAPNCSFYVMDAEKLSFPSGFFHAVWASCSLLHVSRKNILVVLSNIHAILKPKSCFYLSLKQSHIKESFEADARYGGLEKYWSFYEPNELVELLVEAKFQIVDMTIANKSSDYHTHPIIKIFAEKL